MKNKTSIILGLILAGLSAALYAVELYFNVEANDGPFSGLFFIHYIPTCIYLVYVYFDCKGFWKLFQKDNLRIHTLLLILFNICAYSLNRSLPVFNDSSDGLMVFLIIENLVLLSFVLVEKPTLSLQYIATFILMIALPFNIYQTLMILPAAPLGLVGLPFFGISALLFIPILYIICIVTILRTYTWTRVHQLSGATGLIVTIVAISVFCIEWINIESTLTESKLAQDAPYRQDQGIPEWISVAQNMDQSTLTEKYLKTGLVYQKFASYEMGGFSSIWRSSIEEKYIHDPFISIASLFMKEQTLDEMTRIKILNYIYDARHQTSDKFWSGENLKSTQVVTNVELFANEGLSFTEQIITITNESDVRSRWRSQQEALYTFDLPEGGVVSSLSLWIEGQEVKAVLASKKKAKKAYNTIVGKERRDPSVVYWMEGNKIRVRVFPCTPQEARKFKIGVTAPLISDGQNYIYPSISFKGPDYSKATGAVHVVSHGAKIIDSDLTLEKGMRYSSYKGNYHRDWQLVLEKSTIKRSSFSFKNEHYQVEKSTQVDRAFTPQKIYLDLSNAWTSKELGLISKMFTDQEIHVFSTHLSEVDHKETVGSISPTALPTFTLFPFQELDPESALIITKGGMATPNLSDLKGTSFRTEVFSQFKNQKTAPLVIDIGKEPTDYMKSLKEFGVIEHHLMTTDELKTSFETHQWPSVNHDPNLVVIPQNGLSIRKTENVFPGGEPASDHLMRIFYYQKIMREIGNKYFTDDQNEYLEDEIVDQAATANIVTPLSSLIVLETQQDYDRFDIKKKQDSLGNASIGNSGAVPEPHEWALIIIGIGLLFFIYWKSHLAKYTS